ncbi:MAG: type VI secretion system-associated protein TagF [Burkholderiales bacterium]|nr:type VI secretion system-associated protein TagF [Burkholderiales bacterium]
MAHTGLFGKLPAVGDFVSRGFSPTLCEKLDELIQAALDAASRHAIDTRQVMENAWPVMMALRPGALAPTGFAGLWFPSQDRVGRAFPLCIGLEIPESPSPALPWPSHSTAVELMRLAMEATQNGLGVDELFAMLPEPQEWELSLLHDQPFADSSDETVPDVSYGAKLLALQGPEKRMSPSSRALGARLPWVSQVIGTVVTAEAEVEWFFGCRTVPPLAQFAALFDRNWEHWSWSVSPCAELNEGNIPTPS